MKYRVKRYNKDNTTYYGIQAKRWYGWSYLRDLDKNNNYTTIKFLTENQAQYFVSILETL